MRLLLDSNVFMYAAGAAHDFKLPCIRLLERVARGEIEGIIDAEVLQEILHRYRSIGRWEDGKRAYALSRQIVSGVVPVDGHLTDAALNLMDRHVHLSARDALHAAAAISTGCDAISSFDRDFDALPELRRMAPDAFP